MSKVVGIIVFCLVAGTANAALLSRLDGQAYYDDVSGLTWIADANLAQTSGYDADGLLNWIDATNAWPASLAAARYLGVSDWRLPAASEYSSLYTQIVALGSPGPFLNLQTVYWSSTALRCLRAQLCYGGFFNQTSFNFITGAQGQPLDVDDSGVPLVNVELSVWAVRSGDIAAVVPTPAATWLFGSALAAIGAVRRKSRS